MQVTNGKTLAISCRSLMADTTSSHFQCYFFQIIVVLGLGPCAISGLDRGLVSRIIKPFSVRVFVFFYSQNE